MRRLTWTWALSLLVASTSLGQSAGSVAIRNAAGTTTADVRSATPLSATNAVTVILHPNSASIGTSAATKQTTPFSATSLTGTHTSAADTSLMPYASATIGVVYSSGVTGSPSTCTIQMQYSADGTNFFNYGSAISITPASSTQQILNVPSNIPGPLGYAVQYVFACGAYATGGTFTMTVDYTSTPIVLNGQPVQQLTAANLNATVVQGTASNLLAQVSQPTASNLNATVVQPTAANLLGEVQGTIATGSAGSNPVAIGTRDSAGNIQSLETESTATGPLRVALFNGTTEAAISANGLQVQQATGSNLQTQSTIIGATSVFNGQASVTTAAALASNSAKSVCLIAPSANTDIVYLGSSGSVTSGTGFPMYPGQEQCLAISNTNLVFALANSGTQTLAFFGSNQMRWLIVAGALALLIVLDVVFLARGVAGAYRERQGRHLPPIDRMNRGDTGSGAVQGNFKQITTPFSGTSATGTATSSVDVLTSSFASVSAELTVSGITGSPLTCQIAVQVSVDDVNFTGSGIIFIDAGMTGPTYFNPYGLSTPLTPYVRYVYTCGTYPSAGTFTLKTFYSSAAFAGITDSSGRILAAQSIAGALNGQVQGTIATGSAGSNPVAVGARDSSGNVQSLETESTATGPLRIGVFNGTTEAAVKAASTAAVAADPALVVTVSPNTALPAGTNTIGAITWGGAATGGLADSIPIGGTQGANASVGSQNPVQVGGATVASNTINTGQATAAGKVVEFAADYAGNQYSVTNGSDQWSCNITPGGAGAAVSTLCAGALDAGLDNYVSSIYCQDTVTDAGTFSIAFGSGPNCDGGTSQGWGPYTAGTVTPLQATFPIALQAPKGEGICIQGTAKGQCTLTGEIRPGT